MKTPFDKFVGKDIWVKCKDKTYGSSEIYIKFHTIYDDGDIDCSILTDELIAKLPEYNDWYRNKLMTKDDYLDVSEIEVIKPLVTLTSKDIDPDYTDDVNELMSYANTGYWVKVTFSESYYSFESYIKIVNVEGIFVDYQSIRADVLKGEIYEKYDWESALEDIDEVETINIYQIRVCKPLDILSDEEMQEEIERIGAEVAEWGDEW